MLGRAVADVLGLPAADLDWTEAPDITDSALLRWLCSRHHRRDVETPEVEETIRRCLQLLQCELLAHPDRFRPIPGACEILEAVRGAGWQVALATGGWMESARLKLKAAGIRAEAVPISTADEALTRQEIVRLAVNRARGVDSDLGCIVSIGDGVWDLETASALQCRFVGVGNGERAQRLIAAGADVVLPSFSDVGTVLNALERALVP